MRSALLSVLLTLPLLAELPAGTSRITFRDDIQLAFHLAATGDVLWIGSPLDDTLERLELGGARLTVDIPPTWQYTTSFVTGPDGALWLSAPGWIARVDPATNAIERWPLGTGSIVRFILPGPDGNLWLVQDRSVVRMRTDGVFLTAYDAGGEPTGAVFGSDGALYLSLPGKLVRMTVAGETTEFPTSPKRLFAGAGFLWTADFSAATVNEIGKMSDRGETLATYRIDMTPMASDSLGNLWLRATTAAGDVVGQLSPSGVLTRFGPFPSLVSTECHPRYFGHLTFLADGRVAMTDYYPLIVFTLLSPCRGVPRPEEAKNTITILDPRLAPVLSIETLDRTPRRRAVRR